MPSCKNGFCSKCGLPILNDKQAVIGPSSTCDQNGVFHSHCACEIAPSLMATPTLFKKCTRCGRETPDGELVDVAKPEALLPEPVCFKCIDEGNCPECKGRV